MDSPQRTIRLDPADWYWATWRDLPPLPRHETRPFNLEDALARLRKVRVGQRYEDWDWTPGQISLSLTREEAHFWLAAMLMQNYTVTPATVAERLKDRHFDGVVDGTHLKTTLTTIYNTGRPPALIMVPLVILYGVENLLRYCLQGDLFWGRYHSDVAIRMKLGFRYAIVPYLTATERAALRVIVQEFLSNIAPSVTALALAAYLGLHEEPLSHVMSWSSGSSDPPTEEVFGLGSAELMQAQFQRLEITFRSAIKVRAWLAHTEYDALDRIAVAILEWEQNPLAPWEEDPDLGVHMLAVLALVEAPENAPQMLRLWQASKRPAVARAWLEEHPEHTITALVPLVIGQDELAVPATEMLRRLARRGHREHIRAGLAALPDPVDPSIQTHLLAEEADLYIPFDDATCPDWLRTALTLTAAPAKKAKITKPIWVIPGDLPPVTVGRYRLNDAQADSLLLALRRSSLDQPHPYVLAVKTHADRPALDHLAWRLLELWQADGAPAEQNWALKAVGLLGTDSSVLKLTSVILGWRDENQHARSFLGVECLRAIGTDTALMAIHGLAQKAGLKALQVRAAACLERVARDRGLTQAQLEDRIVPTCNLDAHGARSFDYGPRRFRFVLSPELKPMVRDEAGKLLATLPRPGLKDNADLATAALAEWKLLKKQVAAVARVQAQRLESAMIGGRRWSLEDFSSLLVHHPLLGHLVQRLIWTAHDASGALIATFRVGDDGSYAGCDDTTYTPVSITHVGLAHPLSLSPAQLAAWGEILSDYAIVPPFQQLGRPIYQLAGNEANAVEITRFAGIDIDAAVLVFTLDKLDWRRSRLGDGGVLYEHWKPFPDAGVTAVVTYDGLAVGDYQNQKTTIHTCFFLEGADKSPEYRDSREGMPLGQVNPVVISEVLANLTTIAAKGK